MKKKPAELLFELSEEGTAFRLRARSMAALLVWLALGGLTLLLNVFFAEYPMHRAIVALMSVLKYIPMLLVVGGAARAKAAKYLADVYELENEDLADRFLHQIAFGEGSDLPRLVIQDGGVKEEDERSPLILIGGPGRIQVNLDSAALLEKANGSPRVIYPRKEAWRMDGFERLREVGESDALGEREYAVINLREQRITGIRVTARTKDGIPVEARDVKIKFRALRDDKKDDFCCEEEAVRALVYRHMTIVPESRVTTFAGFPWDATVIPLVISEIEKAISSHTADEIAVGIGQKEMDANEDIQKTAQQARVEATGKYEPPASAKNAAAVAVASREKIHKLFFQPEFKQKAAAMGAQVTWIDIGTWQPIGPVRQKIRETWEKARENIKNYANVKAMRKKEETHETLSLMDSLINAMHERISGRGAASKDKSAALRELEELAAKNPNLAIHPSRWESYASKGGAEPPAAVARDMLKAFRKELLAGRAILKERELNLPSEQKIAEISKIEAVLNHINQYFPVTHS